MLEVILAAAAPYLMEAIAAVATACIAWAAAQARARWGLEIEARHREALHSAVMSGVRLALQRGGTNSTGIVEDAVGYVRRSVPDAVRSLKADEALLRDLVEGHTQPER